MSKEHIRMYLLEEIMVCIKVKQRRRKKGRNEGRKKEESEGNMIEK